MNSQLIKILQEAKYAKILYCRAGGGAGSVIMMEYVVNDVLYVLFINTVWRIESQHEVIATSADDVEPINGLIAKAVSNLENKAILSVELLAFYDLKISFENNLCLKVFNVFTKNTETNCNWTISIPSQNISLDVTSEFKIKTGCYY